MARLRAAIVAIRDFFPLTLLGVSVATFASLGLKYLAFVELDLVVLVVGWGALFVVAAATVLTLVGAAWLRFRKSAFRAPYVTQSMDTGLSLPSGVELTSLAVLPLVTVTSEVRPLAWDMQTDGFRSRGAVHEKVSCSKRGRFARSSRRISVKDVFGLTEVAFERHFDDVMEVRPHLGKLSQLPVLVTMTGGEDTPNPLGIAEGDRVDLRKYGPSDPARFIHWKVFARTRKLAVRVPERALQRTYKTVAYLCSGERDEASAAAARVVLLGGGLGDDWVFSADGASSTRSVQEAEQAIMVSGEARSCDIETFVRSEERSGPISLVVFVPCSEGRWMAALDRILAPRQGRVRVVLGVDGIGAAQGQSLPRRVLLTPANASEASFEQVDSLVAWLRARGADVFVVDRLSGHVLSDAFRASLRSKMDVRRAG